MLTLFLASQVAVTAPLIVVPCGELIEGKLGIEATDHYRNRVAIRVILCVLGTIFAELAPGFVHIVSFIGCFCVAMAGFVLPPLFCIQLAIASKHKGKDIGGITTWCQSMWADSELLKDVGLFVIGVIATVITSTLTFIEMVEIR